MAATLNINFIIESYREIERNVIEKLKKAVIERSKS